MKKSVLLALSALLTCSLSFAQDSSTAMSTTILEDQGNANRFTLSLEPIWLLVNGVGLGASYNISNTKSIDLKAMGIFDYEVGDTDDDSSFSFDDSYKMSREEYNLGMTFMLTGSLSTRGLYISPSLGYVSAEITDYGSEKLQGDASSGTARTTIGYRWALNNGMNFNVGGGLLLATGDIDVTVRDSSGNVVLEEESSATGGLALDAAISYTF